MRTRLLAAVLILVFALAGACSAARAHGQAAAGVAGQGQCAGVAKALGLSKDQVTQIQAIVKKFREDAKPVWQSNIPNDQKRDKLQAMKKDAGDAILALLDAQQQEKAKQNNLIDKLLEPRKEGRELRWALAQLGLDAGEKAKIKDIVKDAEAKGKAIREDTSLTPQQKRPKFVELHKSEMDAINAVLTPAQQDKLKQLLASHGGQKQGGGGAAGMGAHRR